MGTYDHIQNSNGLYYLRFLQLLFTCVVLGINGAAISGWKAMSLDNYVLGCKAPSNVSTSVGIAAVTLPALVYLLLCTGYVKLPFIPWSVWAQVTIDVLGLILWIAASATSNFTCNGVCQACTSNNAVSYNYANIEISVGSLTCYCDYVDDSTVKRTLLPDIIARSAATTAVKAWEVGTKIGFDVLMLILFLLSAAYTVSKIHSLRLASKRSVVSTSLNHPPQGPYSNSKGYVQVTEQELPLYNHAHDGFPTQVQPDGSSSRAPLMTAYQPVHQPDQIYAPYTFATEIGPSSATEIRRKPIGEPGLAPKPEQQKEYVYDSEYVQSSFQQSSDPPWRGYSAY